MTPFTIHYSLNSVAQNKFNHLLDLVLFSFFQAVKIFNKSLLKKRRLGQVGDKYETVKKEIAIMKRLDHPNVVCDAL